MINYKIENNMIRCTDCGYEQPLDLECGVLIQWHPSYCRMSFGKEGPFKMTGDLDERQMGELTGGI